MIGENGSTSEIRAEQSASAAAMGHNCSNKRSERCSFDWFTFFIVDFQRDRDLVQRKNHPNKEEITIIGEVLKNNY